MAITKITPLPGPIDTAVLTGELNLIPIPGLSSLVVLRRETDVDGNLVLDGDNKPIPVAPYVMFSSDPLSAAQITAAEAAVAAHVPPPPDQVAADITALRNAGKDAVIVITALVDALLGKGVIVAADVEPVARQAYLDLKVIADRIVAS